MTVMILEIKTHELDGGITVVEMIGRMSLGNELTYAEDRITKLITGGARKVILDLKALNYVDSAAIGVMVMLFGNMSKAGGQLRMAGPTPVVAKIFTITNLNKIVPIDPDVDTAVERFTQAQASGAHATGA